MSDNLEFREMFDYDMFDGETNVGTCNISIHKKHDAFHCPDAWKDKPVLEIIGFGTIGSQNGGYGRAGLQKCYELSQQNGCEGRVVVHATWEAGSFYEHCGFKGINPGKPGIKYFEPTPDNLEKLYKGEKKDNFSFRKSTAFSELNLVFNEETGEFEAVSTEKQTLDTAGKTPAEKIDELRERINSKNEQNRAENKDISSNVRPVRISKSKIKE